MAPDPQQDPETAGEDATFGSQTGPAPDPPSVQPLPEASMAAHLRERGYTVFPPRTDNVAYVPCSMQLVAELAAQGSSPPLVVVDVMPGDVEGSHELILRRPSRAELQAGMARFRSAV